jgi:hypothetical protein
MFRQQEKNLGRAITLRFLKLILVLFEKPKA